MNKKNPYGKRVYFQAVYERSEPAGEEEANTIDLKVQTLVLNMTVANIVFDKSFRMNICRFRLT